MKKNNSSLNVLEITLLACIILLIGIGFGFLYSASKPSAVKYYDNQYHYLIKQSVFLALSVVLFIIAVFLNRAFYKKYIKIIVIFGLLALLIALIPGIGKEVGGARRWIDLRFFQFQPSEIAKLIVVLYLASVLSNKGENIKDFYKGIFPPMILVCFFAVLVFAEPDFSTTFLILFIALFIFFIAGMRLLTLGMITAIGTLAGVLMITIAPYRMRRFFAFLNPWVDPLGSGWHYIQSMKCFALGKWFGVGIGESTQKNMALPEAHNDYIFAIIAEEGGAFLAIIIIVLFAIIGIMGLNIAKRCKDSYSYLLSAGITMLIFIQAAINISVVLSALPSTGITLPFISSGGTSLLISMFSVGMLINISQETKRAET